ncbi:MAG TPA: thiamine phosphate synthase [Helicobacteraceae bacterium]|nr:thiamine phosphate synthase [Helicobacteraceae bacterium]
MRLYALCDQEMLSSKGISIENYIATAISYNAEIIQYRSKNDDIATIKSNLIKIRQLYDGYLIINDVYELISYCDGVHIGQEDLATIDSDPVKAIKTLRSVVGKDKIIGLSTHNEVEIKVANTLDLNYIGLGAYRATTTKEVPNLLGDTLDDLAALSKHKVAAIGGVKREDDFKYVTYHVIGSGLLS